MRYLCFIVCIIFISVTYQMSKHPFEPPSRPIFMHHADRGSPARPNRNISPLNPNKIQSLQKQFQSLKQKIKQVEQKNSEMLSKIKSKMNKTNEDDEISQQIQRFKTNLNFNKAQIGRPKRFIQQFEIHDKNQYHRRQENASEQVNLRTSHPYRLQKKQSKQYHASRGKQQLFSGQPKISSQRELQKNINNPDPQRNFYNQNPNAQVEHREHREHQATSPVTNRVTHRSNSINQNEVAIKSKNQEALQNVIHRERPNKIGSRPKQHYFKAFVDNIDSVQTQQYEAVQSGAEPVPNASFKSRTNSKQAQKMQNYSPEQAKADKAKIIKQAKNISALYIDKFQSHLSSTFKSILKGIQQLNRKILSLDLETEQLKQIARIGKNKDLQSVQVKNIRQRQNDFIINELQNKLKKLTLQNEKIEKQLIDKNLEIERINQEKQSMKQILVQFKEVDRKKDQTRKEQLAKAIKKKEKQMEDKIMDLMKKNQEELKKVSESHENLLKSISSETKKIDNQDHMMYSFHTKQKSGRVNTGPNVSQENNLQQTIEQLQTKLTKIENQNKQYEILLQKKSDQINKMQNKLYESELMSANVKKMLEQLMQQHEKSQNVAAKKDIQNMETIVKMNQAQKKRNKQVQECKSKIMNQLRDACEKKAIRKIKKQSQSDLQKKLNNIRYQNKQGQSTPHESFNISCSNLISQLTQTIAFYQNKQSQIINKLNSLFGVHKIEIQMSGYTVVLSKIEQQQTKLKTKLKQLQQHKLQLQKQLKLTRNSLIVEDRPNLLDKVNEEADPLRGMGKKKSSANQSIQEQKAIKEKDIMKDRMKLLQQSFDRELSYKNAQISQLKAKFQQLDDKFSDMTRKYSQEVANLSNGLILKQKQYDGLENDYKSIEEEKRYYQNKYQQLQQKIKTQRANAQGLNKQGHQKSLANFKQIMQLKNKVKDYEKTNSNLMSKVKKQKQALEATEKSCKQRLAVKSKAIDDLLETKKNLSVEVKVLTQRLSNLKSTKQLFSSVKQTQKLEKSQNLNIIPLQSKIRVKENTDDDYYKLKQEYEQLQQRNVALELEKRKHLILIQEMESKINTNQQKQQIIQQKKMQQNDEFKKTLIRQKQKRESIQKKFEQYKQATKNEGKKLHKQLKDKKDQLQITKQMIEQLKKTDETSKQTIKQLQKKQQELLKVINKIEDDENQNEENQKRMLINSYEQKLQKMDKELRQYIEKYNNVKIELTDQLDGKSDMARNAQFDMENRVQVYKQQIFALEQQLKNAREEIIAKAKLNKKLENQKIKISQQLQEKLTENQNLRILAAKANSQIQQQQQINSDGAQRGSKDNEDNKFQVEAEKTRKGTTQKIENVEAKLEQQQIKGQDIKQVVQNYEKMLGQKQKELRQYIQKYNNAKIELTQQLDGKSDMVRNVQFDLQSVIVTLREQVQALQSNLRSTEEQLELQIKQRSKSKLQIDKINEKLVAKNKQVEKLHQDLFESNLKFQQMRGDENLLEDDSFAEKPKIVTKANEQDEHNEVKALTEKYQRELEQKQKELSDYILKYNNIKIQLQDQLDGKSDLMRNVEDDLQNTIQILKEQVKALESQLTDTKEQISSLMFSFAQSTDHNKNLTATLNQIQISKLKLQQQVQQLNFKIQALQKQKQQRYQNEENEKRIQIMDIDDQKPSNMGHQRNTILDEEYVDQDQFYNQDKNNIRQMEQKAPKQTSLKNVLNIEESEMGGDDNLLVQDIQEMGEQMLILDDPQKQQKLSSSVDNRDNTLIINLTKKYENLLSQKQQQLRNYILKYNTAKMELQQQLDGKSDIVRNIQSELRSAISVLKQENDAQEIKIKSLFEQCQIHKEEIHRVSEEKENIQQKLNQQIKQSERTYQQLNKQKESRKQIQQDANYHVTAVQEKLKREYQEAKKEYERKLDQKQQQINQLIQKFNDNKLQLIQEMQGKSSIYRNSQYDYENHINVLKEQIEAMEKQNTKELEQKEERINLYKERLDIVEMQINRVKEEKQGKMRQLKEQQDRWNQKMLIYNDEKEKLMDELDGRSEMIRNMKYDSQGHVSLLKEQVEALENKLKACQQDLKNQQEQNSKLKQTLTLQTYPVPIISAPTILKLSPKKSLRKSSQFSSQSNLISSSLPYHHQSLQLAPSPPDLNFQIATQQQFNQSISKDKLSSILSKEPLDIPFNSDLFESYLRNLKTQIINIVSGDQPFYSEQFLEQHSPDGILTLEELKVQLLTFINQNKHQDFLEQLAFIDRHDFDLCSQVDQEELEELTRMLRPTQQTAQHQANTKQADKQIDEKSNARLQQLAKQNSDLSKELTTLKLLIEDLRKQNQLLAEEKDNVEEENQRQFINQSQIYKKQIMKEKQRADGLTSTLESLKKIFEKMLQTVFADQTLSEDIEDCLEHYQNICSLKNQKQIKLFQEYKERYDKMREVIQRSKIKQKEKKEGSKEKTKKGWF